MQIGLFTYKTREMLWFTVRNSANSRRDMLVLMDLESGKAIEIICQRPGGVPIIWPDDTPFIIDGEAGLAYFGDSKNSANEKSGKRTQKGQICVYDISSRLENLLKKSITPPQAAE